MTSQLATKAPETSGNLRNADAPISDRVDQEKVLEFIFLTTRDGLSITEACQIVGISDRTARNWRASEWWPTAMMIAESHLRDEYLHTGLRALNEAAKEGNTKAAAALVACILKMQSAPRLAPPESPNTIPTSSASLADTTDEELRALAAKGRP